MCFCTIDLLGDCTAERIVLLYNCIAAFPGLVTRPTPLERPFVFRIQMIAAGECAPFFSFRRQYIKRPNIDYWPYLIQFENDHMADGFCRWQLALPKSRTILSWICM